MKEITLKLADGIADHISNDAKETGLTSEELIKYIVGTYVQSEKRAAKHMIPRTVVGIDIEKLMEQVTADIGKSVKEFMKNKAELGELTCKNCTMKLTGQDIDDDKCHVCGAPIKDALGGSL